MSKTKLTTPVSTAPAAAPIAETYLPLLLALFVGSGCAALIYEVVWFQLLQLVIGSSALSLGVLLGTYMGGMCLGSLLLSRYVSAREHPLRVYAFIEGAIGVCGLLVLWGLPLIDKIYAAIAGQGLWGILLRAIICAICLLPPTLLMGASLPAIARWIETSHRGVSWLGFFYGGNIAGAVFGCLFAGFYLLRVYDMATATYAAVLINAAVAFVSFQLSKRASYAPAAVSANAKRQSGSRAVYITIAISGMCALGAEVIWTRLLSLMLGATVYTFSIILAVFLVGLGIGSAVGSQWSRQLKDARLALGVCQMLLVAGIAWAAYTLAVSIPNWPVNPLLAKSAWFNFQLDLMRCAWAILPAAFLWGASFPLALAAVVSPHPNMGEDAGKLVGEVYAANTIGGIFGALGFSVVFIPWIGSQDSERLLIALAGIGALAIFVSAWSSLKTSGVVALIASLVVGLWLVANVPEMPWLAIAYGRRMMTTTNPGRALYVGEGRNSSIAVSELPGGEHYFHVSGKVEASTEPYDMRLQRMLGHLPALLHPGPKSVLVVGFGAGVTAGTFVVHPTVQKITICELEPLIPPVSTQYFARENYNVLNDARTQIHYDDARHFVLTSKEKFDIITSDPIHPWVKGTSSLYSKEYFQMVKDHLNPGGIVTQWVPLYESDENTVKSELATFFQVFPNGTVWGNDIEGDGYDVVLLGTSEPLKIDLDAMQQRWDRPDQSNVVQSLNETRFNSPISLLSTYAGRASDLAPWLQGAPINDDLSMRLQYLAGMGLNYDAPAVIYSDMLGYRKIPEDMFTGSPDRLAAVRMAISTSGRKL
jgi:spermidine synthase